MANEKYLLEQSIGKSNLALIEEIKNLRESIDQRPSLLDANPNAEKIDYS